MLLFIIKKNLYENGKQYSSNFYFLEAIKITACNVFKITIKKLTKLINKRLRDYARYLACA